MSETRHYLIDNYSMNQATFQSSFYILANQDSSRTTTKGFVDNSMDGTSLTMQVNSTVILTVAPLSFAVVL